MHIQVAHPAGTNMHICMTFFATKLAVSRKLTLISATSISNGMVYVFCKIHYRDFFTILASWAWAMLRSVKFLLAVYYG